MSEIIARCNVSGSPAPGSMCGQYKPGSGGCASTEMCEHRSDAPPSYTPEQEAAQLFRVHSQSVIDQLSHRQLLISLTAIQGRLDTEFNERNKK